ncbi:hypothetical protein EDC04DRAFT_3000014 [Pisolithus marmoratus]|nr:hypothetical protein EDC04DRAFT_3000014 [Pisolithus marmoratus]
MQPATYEFGEDRVGVHDVHGVGTAEMSGSELMGALGGDNIASGYDSVLSLNMSGLGGMPMNMNSMGLGMDREGAANRVTLGGIHVGGTLGHAYGIFGHHAYPGPYHLDYLSSQFHLDVAFPFAGVDGMEREESPTSGCASRGNEGEGNEADVDEHRTSKHHQMSTDSASEPPSSAVSYSSYAESMMLVSTAPTSVISGHSPHQTQQQGQALKSHGHRHSQLMPAQAHSQAQSMPQSQDQEQNFSGSHLQGHAHGHSQSLSLLLHSSSLAHAHSVENGNSLSIQVTFHVQHLYSQPFLLELGVSLVLPHAFLPILVFKESCTGISSPAPHHADSLTASPSSP